MPRDMLTSDPPTWLNDSAPSTATDNLRHPTAANQRHFLLICGPFGSFTRRLGGGLRAAGARCSRVILNGGDLYDWGWANAPVYRGRLEDFGAWISAWIDREGVTDVIVYGDAHPYCAAAAEAAGALGMNVHVLEQGYFRPFWITLERGGVNGNSRLPRDPEVYRREAQGTEAPKETWLPPLTPPSTTSRSGYGRATTRTSARRRSRRCSTAATRTRG